MDGWMVRESETQPLCSLDVDLVRWSTEDILKLIYSMRLRHMWRYTPLEVR